jgi:hypothetical protein
MSETSNLNNTVDSAIVSYGRAKTYMGTIVGSSVLTIFLIIGIFILSNSIKNKSNYKSTEAKILNIAPSGRNNYIARVTYNISNKSYENTVNLNYYRSVGSYITIYYDKYNPNTAQNSSPTYKIFVGTGLIVCILLSCALMFYNAYMVKNSNFAAQDAAFSSSYNSYGMPYNRRSLISIF